MDQASGSGLTSSGLSGTVHARIDSGGVGSGLAETGSGLVGMRIGSELAGIGSSLTGSGQTGLN